MKKIIISSLAAIAAVSAACYANLNPEPEVSQLTLDNIDALSVVEFVYDANCVQDDEEICCPDNGPIVYRSRGV